MKNRLKTILPMFLVILFPVSGLTEAISDYLILQDIGRYKLGKPEKVFAGEPPIGGPRMYGGPGIIGATGHFPDHKDMTYEVMYIGGGGFPSPSVQVTQHADSDSDKWLLHEVGRDFRNYYGLPGDSYVMSEIDGNTIMAAGSAGWAYRWVSGSKVIHIGYTDLQMTKHEPLEVVKAYLAKHPSTLLPMTSADLRTTDNETKWIKDEMERRLWLCDTWFLQLQIGKAEQNETLRTVVKHMVVFLNYREKYYGIKASDEKRTLDNYLINNNGTAIKNKLTEYKTWWNVNKGKSISLP